MDPNNPQPEISAKKRNIALLKQWVATAAGVVVALNVVSGIKCDSLAGLVIASLALGVLNITFGGLKIFLGCLSLGLFAMLLNALLLMLVAWAVEPFHVESFSSAFLGGIIISLVSIGVLMLTGTSRGKGGFRNSHFEVNIQTSRSRQNEEEERRRRIKDDDDDGSGPVIDI